MAKQKAQNGSAPQNQEIPAAAFDEALATWWAPTHLRYERGWLWFALVFLFCGGLALYGYLTDSTAMTVVFAITPLVLILEHLKKPKMLEVVVSPYGIRFGNIRIPYSSVRRFWILHNPPVVDELHLLTNSRVHPEVTIQLMGMDANLLRMFLITQAIEWEGKKLGTLDTLVRLLRLA
jgi:hypothetical protein